MVTIGIWSYADLHRLENTLVSLRAYTTAPYKLVVLGDGLRAARDGHNMHLDTDRPLGAAACFNRLIAHDDADVVVFLESGSIVTPRWLDLLLEGLQADPGHGLAGPSTNRAWNAQRQCDAPGDDVADHAVASYAAQLARRYQGTYRTLEPLYSLADFCYVVRRQVIDAVGAADAQYGLGPCWEMDYNIRAARAGFKGVWACAAYVHRPPVPAQRHRDETRFFAASRRRYQDKFCRLKLARQRRDYCGHCEGDACTSFAPRELIQIRCPLGPSQRHSSAPMRPAPRLQHAPAARPPLQRQTAPRPQHRRYSTAEPWPMVSCIMPTHNRRPFVAQALQYFLRQDYPQCELIIVDDGSEPVRDLIPDDPRLRYLRLDRKRTIGAKRNLACQEARGEVIVHWDDDDWMAPWRLRYQVDSLRAAQADICGLDQVLFYDPLAQRAWQYMYPRNAKPWVAGGTLCYTKAFWQRHPFPDLNIGEDARFVWATTGKSLLALQEQTFYVAMIHPGNTSPKRTADQRWHPYPAGEVRALLGEDWGFYHRRAQDRTHDAARRSSILATPIQVGNRIPLVSCIMPTYSRRRFVPQAIRYFLRQDYPERELIVVDDGADAVGDLIPNDPSVRYLRLSHKHSIGAKRNLACEAAKGAIILCWDDDDWYAPHRISYQVAPLLEGKADVTGLDRGLLFCLPSRQFWTYTAHLHSRMFAQGVVGGTTAFWKRLWEQGARFPDASLAEDAAFLQALARRGARLAKLTNAGTFIYVRHDQNSWRFTPGRFLDGSSWQRVELPAFIPEPDRAFYGLVTPAAAGRGSE